MSGITLKKLSTNIGLAFAITVSSQANADFLGIYAGAGVWQSSVSGDLSNTDAVSIDELNVDDAQNTVIYVALEHPIPVIPNLRLSMTNISTEGESTIDREIILNDNFTFPANADTQSELDLSHIDYTLYYEVLDNYASLDIGLTGRAFSGKAELSYTTGEDPDTESDTEQVDLDGIIPMAYTKVQIDLPFTGWYFGGSANFVSFQDNSITDAEAKVGYMTNGLGLDFGFDLGYRSFTIAAEPDDDDFKADLTLDGPYASLLVHF